MLQSKDEERRGQPMETPELKGRAAERPLLAAEPQGTEPK